MSRKDYDLGMMLGNEARRMVAFAHEPEHYLYPDKGDSPDRTWPSHMILRLKLPNWETQVKFCYSVDVLRGKATRHLSISISVPGFLTQGEVNQVAPELLEVLQEQVRCFFPLVDGIAYQITALAPVPVVDSRMGRRSGNVHFRTPVTYHFLVDHGVVDEEAAKAPPPMRALARRLAVKALGIAVQEAKTLPSVEISAEEKAELVEELHAMARRVWNESALLEPDTTETTDDEIDDVPRYLRFAMANAQRAFEQDDVRSLATINEDLQGLVDAAVSYANRRAKAAANPTT